MKENDSNILGVYLKCERKGRNEWGWSGWGAIQGRWENSLLMCAAPDSSLMENILGGYREKKVKDWI